MSPHQCVIADPRSDERGPRPLWLRDEMTDLSPGAVFGTSEETAEAARKFAERAVDRKAHAGRPATPPAADI